MCQKLKDPFGGFAQICAGKWSRREGDLIFDQIREEESDAGTRGSANLQTCKGQIRSREGHREGRPKWVQAMNASASALLVFCFLDRKSVV